MCGYNFSCCCRFIVAKFATRKAASRLHHSRDRFTGNKMSVLILPLCKATEWLQYYNYVFWFFNAIEIRVFYLK